MSDVSLIGALDPAMGWDGAHIYDPAAAWPPARLAGAAAGFYRLRGGGARVLRDPLGLGKVFWARSESGDLAFAARPARLVQAGYRFDDIRASPRGHSARVDARGRLAERAVIERAGTDPGGGASAGAIAASIRRGLDSYLAAVAAAHPNRRAYVCLSGGLDSSTVAVLARRHFSALTAVSFDLAASERGESEDRACARRLAADLDMPLLEATAGPADLLSHLDLVLVEGIDWRDFNVHCGLVNAVLAEAIARDTGPQDPPPIVVTGDLPNELLVDYHAETYRGRRYYELPRLEVSTLRRALVDGLDTCHREVGVFGAFGLAVAQPYAACAPAYLRLPADALERDDRKDRLVWDIVGSELPEYIYRRPKVRAQLGDAEGGGALAACVDRGVDGPWLRRRFAQLHGIEDESALDRFIRAGRYRAELPGLTEERHGYA